MPPRAIALRPLGARVLVRPGNPRIAEQVRETWARCLDPADPAAGASYDEEIWVSGPELAMSRATELRLTSRINLAGLAALEDHVALHASAVAAPDGGVLGLVAPSGTGKTTAAIALGRLGLGYVTDETLAVDREHRVAALPKPLSRVVDDGEKVLVGPDRLRLPVAPDRLHLRALVLLSRDPGCPAPRLDPVPLPEALPALVAQASGLERLAAPLSRLAGLAEHVGGVLRLTYAEIADAAPLLVELLDSPGGPRLRTADLDDTLVVDEQLALLRGGALLLVSGVGRIVLDLARHGCSRARLEQSLRRQGLDPTQAAGAVDDLVAAGLLVRDESAPLDRSVPA